MNIALGKVVDSWPKAWRFVFTISSLIGVFALCVLAVAYLSGLIVEARGVKVKLGNFQHQDDKSDKASQLSSIEMNDHGMTMEFDDGSRIAQILLPANQLWLETGLEIEKGSLIRIEASGAVNLAQHLANDLARDPKAQEIDSFKFLVNTDGKALNGRTPKPRLADALRKDIALLPSAPLGSLVYTIAPRKSLDRMQPRPKPEHKISIYQASALAGTGQVPADIGIYQRGVLFLSVNDFVLTYRDKDRDIWALKYDQEGQEGSCTGHLERIQKAFSYKEIDSCRPRNDQAKACVMQEPSEYAPETACGKLNTMYRYWDTVAKQGRPEAFYEDNGGVLLVTVHIQPPQ